jgi:hypothetical protein
MLTTRPCRLFPVLWQRSSCSINGERRGVSRRQPAGGPQYQRADAAPLAKTFPDPAPGGAPKAYVAGQSPTAIATALHTVYQEGGKSVAYTLTQAGVGATDIAQALQAVLGETDVGTVQALLFAGQSPTAIATALGGPVFRGGRLDVYYQVYRYVVGRRPTAFFA